MEGGRKASRMSQPRYLPKTNKPTGEGELLLLKLIFCLNRIALNPGSSDTSISAAL